MLGLLPSDQFSVSVTIFEQPLYRLLIYSIITGYTLWNAEYRVSLRRNFDIPTDPRKEEGQSSKDDVGFGSEKGVSEDLGNCVEELERLSPQVFGDLSPEALSYIQHLQSELSTMKEICPVCSRRVKMHMVDHITTQHRDVLKIDMESKLKLLYALRGTRQGLTSLTSKLMGREASKVNGDNSEELWKKESFTAKESVVQKWESDLNKILH